ncbi:MAG: glutathione peroxidase [Bacteroidota bacterium]|nr:glutathione peroxidase [Bacteroidota bacterium]
MTFRQAILKTFYPVIMFFGKVFPSKHAVLENSQHQAPLHSFYTLKAIANDGSTYSFSGLQGKKVMIVNTASDCGFTAQYAELEKLYEAHKSNLVIIAFPANDFQQQEKGSNAEIASFCKKNYGVSFPLMQKSVVIEKAGQNEVFQWLTQASGNGWCTQPPVWNFCKYIINEQGILTHFFSNTVSPLDKKVLKALAE